MSVYVQPHGIRESLKVRRSEWGLAAWLAIAWGYTLVFNPTETLALPSFAVLYQWASYVPFGSPDEVVGTGCLLVGGVRLAVLLINGRWRKCSLARMILAGLSCFFWAAFALGFSKVDVGSPGAIGYFIFLLLDLHTIGEAASDARGVRDRDRASIA